MYLCYGRDDFVGVLLSLVGWMMWKLIHSIHNDDSRQTAQVIPLVLLFMITVVVEGLALRKIYRRWMFHATSVTTFVDAIMAQQDESRMQLLGTTI
jgi:hypothetical protein